MRREVLSVLAGLALLAGAALPAAADGGCGYKAVTASSDQATHQQTAQVQAKSDTATQ